METNKVKIRIKNHELPKLLSEIGEVLRTGEDLILSGEVCEEEPIEFSETEIREIIETEFYCPELEEDVTAMDCGWCELGSTCGVGRTRKS